MGSHEPHTVPKTWYTLYIINIFTRKYRRHTDFAFDIQPGAPLPDN